MKLFRLTTATIFKRKAWAVCTFAVLALPFALPAISTAIEKPILVQPARVQAAWAMLWLCTIVWGLYTAARQGESNAESGVGEYFQTSGTGPSRQLFQIWLAIFIYILPLVLITVLICQFAARPGNPVEREWWLTLNVQYAILFLLVTGPLLALAISIASRFGGISGFSITLLLTFYGLYGVGFLDNMMQVEGNSIIQQLLQVSPQYRFADLTQRLYFKSGALSVDAFVTMSLYFLGICAIYLGISRLLFRTKSLG